MKRIYMTLGLIAALGTASYAQVADLESQVIMADHVCLDAGKTIQNDSTVTDQPYGIWGVVNNGPETITANSTLMLIFPFCTVSSTGASVYAPSVSQDAVAGSVVLAISQFPVDSINTLLNIDSLKAGANQWSSLLVSKNQLVEGATYGFYLYTIGTGTNPNTPDNTDTVLSNNLDFVPVVWHCNTGVRDMMEEAAQNISIFPNPAQNELHFRYGFIKPTAKATARVIDMTGRILKSQELGKNAFGTKEFTMDISSLPAGNYMLEISTDYINAVGKFTVTR